MRVVHHVHDDRGVCERWSHMHDERGVVIPGTFHWEHSPCAGRWGPPA